MVDNELVVPDDGSVTATITTVDGTVKTGFNNLSLTPDANQAFVVLDVPSSVTTKANNFELCQITINFLHNSKPHKQYIDYRVVDRVNIPVSADEVRATLGLSVDEWSDDNIDLVTSFAEVGQELTDQGLDIETILTSGASIVRNLLNAIKYKAALGIVPVLEMIAVQSLQADNVSFKRFDKVDFQELRYRLDKQYVAELDVITSQNDINLTYTTTGLGTDAVTGS
jgi:hypothetical protein